MKLNYDCIRDLLLLFENKLSLNENLKFEPLALNSICTSDEMSKYSKKEITYTIVKLKEAGYINALIIEADNGIYGCQVTDITYCGHEFLQSIKPDDVWEKVKIGCNKVGTISFPIISQVASKVISSFFT